MYRPLLFCALMALVASPAGLAGGPQVRDGHWIVTLEEPPAVRFEGGEHQVLQGDGSSARQVLAPTSPRATGQRRLDAGSAATRAYTAHLDQRQEAFLETAAAELGRELDVGHRYRLIANGFSAQMSDAEAERLAGTPGVASVTPVFVHRPLLDAGPARIGALPQQLTAAGVPVNRGEDVVIGVIDSGIEWDHPYFDPEFSNHSYSNPYSSYLGECSSAQVNCNDKLVGVYDMTSEGSSGRDTTGHGTHVASTAAGNPLLWTLNMPGGDTELDAPGVAANATLISYKVCYDEHPDDSDLDGRCTGDAIMAALEQAIDDGVDVVNYSIGGDASNPWNTIGSSQTSNAEKFLNLREAGIVPVSSAGNSGPAPGSITNPANAPWVIAVGNISHDRRFANPVTDLSGGPFELEDMFGTGATEGTDLLPIVHAADYGYPLCGTGEPELGPGCEDNTGASNPFDPGTFEGKIVVCDRGDFGRVEKGFNVAEAGAAGMIMANTPEWGESVVSDAHCLPGTNVGSEDGDRLREWLSSGSDHQGALAGETLVNDESFANRTDATSSRGPKQFAPEVMKPNLVAPGTDILAAEGDEGLSILSGTSMSSPHVAGAAAILLSLNPDWTVSMVQSALETTSSLDGLLTETGDPAQAVDRGTGQPNVAEAARAGLYLDVTESQFRNGESNPGALNLPGMINTDCRFECSFTRTVTAIESGNWSVSGEGPAEVSVEPAEFSLQAGESQVLEITLNVNRPEALGEWSGGRVVLEPASPDMATQFLTAGVRPTGATLPESIDLQVDSSRGRESIVLEEVAELPEAVFRSSPLVRPDQHQVSLPEDGDSDDPFDGSGGTHVEWLEVPEDALMLYAEILGSTASHVDLYVGRDDFGTGDPEEESIRCESSGSGSLEECLVDNPEPGNWWVLVQNRAGSAQPTDSVDFRTAVLGHGPDPSLVLGGPARHPGGELELELAWDQDAMELDTEWLGAVSLGTDPDRPGNVGVVPVNLTRTAPAEIHQTALTPGRPHELVMPGTSSHDRLFVDVPESAGSLEITVDGSGLDVMLARRDFADLEGVEPETPPAPQAGVVSGSTGSDGVTLTVGGSDLEAGRWYVVLDRAGTGEESVTVEASIESDGAGPSHAGLWSPALRSTNQGFSWSRVGNSASMIWYTYDEQGQPTFYLAEGALDADGTHWRGDLYAYTGNRERQIAAPVGNAVLSFLDEFEMSFSWNVKGHHGSERMDITAIPTCPSVDGAPASFSGDWYNRDSQEGGVSVVITTSGQAVVRYYYDSDHNARWFLGDTADGGAGPVGTSFDLDVFSFTGFCPWCETIEPESQVVGSYALDFESENRAFEAFDVDLPAPMSESYAEDHEIGRLSSPVACVVVEPG